MARNHSGRLSGSICRNSNATLFSRSTIAARCTQGQVLKLTRRYFAIISSPVWCRRCARIYCTSRAKEMVKWPRYFAERTISNDQQMFAFGGKADILTKLWQRKSVHPLNNPPGGDQINCRRPPSAERSGSFSWLCVHIFRAEVY